MYTLQLSLLHWCRRPLRPTDNRQCQWDCPGLWDTSDTGDSAVTPPTRRPVGNLARLAVRQRRQLESELDLPRQPTRLIVGSAKSRADLPGLESAGPAANRQGRSRMPPCQHGSQQRRTAAGRALTRAGTGRRRATWAACEARRLTRPTRRQICHCRYCAMTLAVDTP